MPMLGISLALAVVWLVLVRTASHCLVWFTCLVGIGISVGAGFYLLSTRVWLNERTLLAPHGLFFHMLSVSCSTCSDQDGMGGAVFCFLWAALQGLWVFLVRDRIAFAAACLELAGEFIRTYPSTVVCSLFFLVVQVRSPSPPLSQQLWFTF
jgi:hypothetical protein